MLFTEGRLTVIDGLLTMTVLLGLVLNATLGWWWADPVAGLVIVYYPLKEAHTIYTDTGLASGHGNRRGNRAAGASSRPADRSGLTRLDQPPQLLAMRDRFRFGMMRSPYAASVASFESCWRYSAN